MNRQEFEDIKFEFTLKTLGQQEQFAEWLRFFFFLNHELQKEYDSVYQQSFYVKLYELLTEGLKYAKNVLEYLSNGSNTKKEKWYKSLINNLEEIRNQLTDDEFLFIEFQRHSASHIFQNKYVVDFKKDGTFKTQFKDGSSLNDIQAKFYRLLNVHGGAKGFDIYITQKLQQRITGLHQDLQAIHSGA